MLAAIGRPFRQSFLELLHVLALCVHFIAWGMRPFGRPLPERREFFRRLRQALLGGMLPSLVLGVLIGMGLVFQGITWAGAADQRGLLATVLVTVLVRELAPVLIATLILGRSGIAVAADLGALRATGAERALTLQGVDLVRLYAAPAAVAQSLSCLTLGIIFVAVALVSGSAFAALLGGQSEAILGSLNDVLRAMSPADVVIFPAKLLVTGMLVGAVVAHTPLTAPRNTRTSQLLPACFVRGVLAILTSSVVLSLAV
ncbi:MlaE family ABC transporter permease [Roseococcus sp. YIM B11640]|uniref:MlaE family ABC transporter permease n=1 Tax=Roseococcus sp. YIM B11640 TaxID=3133973 RepID=UPI003C7B7E8D